MRYLSDDGKVFDTDQECYKYEQRLNQEKARREAIEKERKNRLNAINNKYNELQKMIADYKDDYEVRLEGHFTSFPELLRLLYR